MSTINFSGIASGIDTNALIDATSAATRRQKVTPKTTKIEELTATNTAFDELKTRLRTLKTLAEGMGTINGGIVAKSATSSSESVVTASVRNGALNGAYDVEVLSLAKTASYSFNYAYSSTSETLFGAGETGTVSFDFGDTSAESVSVNVTSNMTVSEFINAFNNASSRAEASVVQVSPTDYRILITTKTSGTDSGAILNPVVSGTGPTKITTGDVTSSAATDASFRINGIGPFTRQSNTINDVISQVTFNLLGINSPSTAKVTISDDPDTSVAAMRKFIDAYNEVAVYVRDNSTISREESNGEVENIFGPLASTRTDDSALTSIREVFAGIAYSGTSTIRILADLGVESQRDGTLLLNETKFKNAISTDSAAVTAITTSLGDKLGFTFNPTTGNGVIDSIIGFNRSFDTSINSNKTLIDTLNTQTGEVEKQIAQSEANMRAQFARLESLMGRLQQQQQALTSALAGLR